MSTTHTQKKKKKIMEEKRVSFEWRLLGPKNREELQKDSGCQKRE